MEKLWRESKEAILGLQWVRLTELLESSGSTDRNSLCLVESTRNGTWPWPWFVGRLVVSLFTFLFTGQ